MDFLKRKTVVDVILVKYSLLLEVLILKKETLWSITLIPKLLLLFKNWQMPWCWCLASK